MNKIPLGKPMINVSKAMEKIEQVLDTKWISGGPTIAKFEDAVKKYNNDETGNYVAVANGTVAIEMALLALNGGERYTKADQVIVPSWSWVASAFAVTNVGATPIFCDVDKYGCPSVSTIDTHLNKKTKAVIVVHQMGIPCDMTPIEKLCNSLEIPIIEDAACGFGSEYKGKRIGDSQNIVTYSFQARKCLTCGEGGMIITKNKDMADWFRSYRAFGTSVSPLERDKAQFLLKEKFDFVGTNYKMADIPCALGLAQLESFDEEINMRDTAGKYYNSLIKKMKADGFPVEVGNKIPEYCTRYNWQNFHLTLTDENINRDQVVDLLRKRGIGCKWDIQAIHKEPAYGIDIELQQTDIFHDKGLWLAFYAEITPEIQNEVINNLKEVLDELR